MSKILAITPNHFVDQKNREVIPPMTRRNSQNPSFGLNFSDLKPDARKFLLQGCEEKPGFIRKKINDLSIYLKEHDGELQSQAINAVFTTTFAPLFIAYNPFTKQDKKTKEYTAIRQPISAIIALTCSMPITRAFNNYLGKKASDGEISKYDLRISQEKAYLEKEFKNNYKLEEEKGTLNEFLQRYVKDDSDDLYNITKFKADGKPTKEYKRLCKNAYAEIKQKNRQKLFTRLISEVPNNIKLNANGVISINGVLHDEKIPNLDTQEALNKYLDQNNLHNKTLSQFLEEEFKVEFYKDKNGNRVLKPYSIETKLKEIRAVDFLDRLGLIDKTKVSNDDLKTDLSKIRQEKITIPNVQKTFKDGVLTDSRGLVEEIEKEASRATEMAMPAEFSKESTISLGKLLHRLGIKNDKNDDLQKWMSLKLNDVLADFKKDKLRNLNTGEKDSKTGEIIRVGSKEVKDFASNMIKNKAARLDKYFGVYKKYAGIFLNLPVTILSCTVLNWAYPRIVEHVFPSLVKDDVKKGGNK